MANTTTKSRCRQWVLVLNPKAMENVKMDEKLALNGLNYAYIVHKPGEEQQHTHLVLDFVNARSFESISKLFPGAHIEKAINIASSVQYLTHKNDKKKEQYELKDVATNNEDWLKRLYNQLSYEYINDENVLLDELLTGNYQSIYDIIVSRRYSMEWLQRRERMISVIISNRMHDEIEEKKRKRMEEKVINFFGE